MITTKTLEQLNRELGDQVLDDAKRNPSAYAGKFVGIANGKIVIATDDLDELMNRLGVEPDPAKTYCVEIGRDYKKVYQI
jgi:hypothetical protein